MRNMVTRIKRQNRKRQLARSGVWQKNDRVYCKNYCCDGSGENVLSVVSAMKKAKLDAAPYIMMG